MIAVPSRLPHFKGASGDENQKLSLTTNAPKNDYENIVGCPTAQKPLKSLTPLNDIQDTTVNKTLDPGDDVLYPCAPPNLSSPSISEPE